MFKLNSKLTMACSAAVLALAMAACSSSSDDNPPVAMQRRRSHLWAMAGQIRC